MNFERIEDIEAYLEGQMSDKQRQAFAAEMAQDPELAAAVATHRRVMQGLDDHFARQDAARQAIAQAQQNLQEEGLLADTPLATPDPSARAPVSQVRRFPRWRYLAAAAVVLLVLVAGYLVNRPPKGARMLAEYHETHPDDLSQGLESMMGSLGFGPVDTNRLAMLVQAMKPYRQGDYAESKRRLQAYQASYPQYRDDPAVQFFLAQIAIEEGAWSEAEQLLAQVVDNPQYGPAATWDLALVQLALKKEAPALSHLERLQQHPDYEDEAEELLEAYRD